jgi:hypothetical protein
MGSWGQCKGTIHHCAPAGLFQRPVKRDGKREGAKGALGGRVASPVNSLPLSRSRATLRLMYGSLPQALHRHRLGEGLPLQTPRPIAVRDNRDSSSPIALRLPFPPWRAESLYRDTASHDPLALFLSHFPRLSPERLQCAHPSLLAVGFCSRSLASFGLASYQINVRSVSSSGFQNS